MNFIALINIYDGSVVEIFKTLNDCAKYLNVSPQAVHNSFKKHYKCKNFFIREINIDNKKILNYINDK